MENIKRIFDYVLSIQSFDHANNISDILEESTLPLPFKFKKVFMIICSLGETAWSNSL